MPLKVRTAWECCFLIIAHLCVPCCTELGELIQTTRAMINFFSKAKAAKLLRELVDSFLDMGHATGKEVPTGGGGGGGGGGGRRGGRVGLVYMSKLGS